MMMMMIVGVAAEDFRKADSDAEQIIVALQYKHQCSIIVHSNHDTR